MTGEEKEYEAIERGELLAGHLQPYVCRVSLLCAGSSDGGGGGSGSRVSCFRAVQITAPQVVSSLMGPPVLVYALRRAVYKPSAGEVLDPADFSCQLGGDPQYKVGSVSERPVCAAYQGAKPVLQSSDRMSRVVLEYLQ